MSDIIKDGGPAFPEIINIEHNPVKDLDRGGRLVNLVAIRGGMSLRDWFAGMALQGSIASYAGANCPDPSPERLAETSYQRANAMLAEREKTK